jgi:hypothetical protein
MISEKLKPYPEIVEAFYRQDVVHALCQPWGLRQRLLEGLQRLHQDGNRIPVPPAVLPPDDKNEMADFLDHKEISLGGYGSFIKTFRYADAFVDIDGLLPTQQDYFGSCLIKVKQSNLDGCSFNLGHRDIVNLFVRGAGTLPTSDYRVFFVHSFEIANQHIWSVQLRAVRLYFHEKSFVAFCEAVDALAEAYTDALKSLESIWGAERFPFAYRDAVTVFVGHIPVWVWRALLDFAEGHDAETGDSEWHIFDAPRGGLKVYTRSSNKLLNRGYHALITASEPANSARLNDRIRLYWRPPNLGYDKLSERDYWPCEFAFVWLRDKLIPHVLHEIWRKERGVRWMRRRRECDETAPEFRAWQLQNQIVDPRSPLHSATYAVQDMAGLWYAVSELQRRYTTLKADQPISGEVISGIYEMLVFLASRAEMSYWGYVSSKLNIHGGSKPEILSEILKKGESIRFKDDVGWMVDEAMRVAMEIIDHGSVELTSEEVAACLKHLRPVIQVCEQSDFINCHLLPSE